MVSPAVESKLAGYAAQSVQRLWGADRFATAAAISQHSHPAGADVVYVANGLGFADALAGGPAAAGDGAPLLLVTTDAIPSATAAELTRLSPSRIFILGGSGVVSAEVETQLAGYASQSVQRLWGADRFATAAAISQHSGPENDVVYVANGFGFADALAGGPAAAGDQGSLLLVTKDTIPAATAAELQRIRPQQIVILGGSGVVSSQLACQLGDYIG